MGDSPTALKGFAADFSTVGRIWIWSALRIGRSYG